MMILRLKAGSDWKEAYKERGVAVRRNPDVRSARDPVRVGARSGSRTSCHHATEIWGEQNRHNGAKVGLLRFEQPSMFFLPIVQPSNKELSFNCLPGMTNAS